MRVESIRTGYGDLRQVGISYLWPPSSKNGVRGDRSLESTPPRPISSDMTSGEAGWIPVVRQVIKHVHYFRVVCYPIGNCEWWTRASDYSVYLFPYPILNRVRFSPWTRKKLSDMA